MANKINLFAVAAFVSVLITLAQAGSLVILPCSGEHSPSLSPLVSLSSPNFTDGTSEATLVRGQKYTLIVTFVSATAASELTTVASALAAGLELPWNGINPSTCANVSPVCPFVRGQTYVYTNTITVLTSYPAITLRILWKVKISETQNEVCFQLPARIQ